jgi:hypothetical protein
MSTNEKPTASRPRAMLLVSMAALLGGAMVALWPGPTPALALAASALAASEPAAASAPQSASAPSASPALEAARRRYPGAAFAPRSQPGWQRLANHVESAAPLDEAASGSVTDRGTPLLPRNPRCFPTEMRNVFSEVDQVVGSDGKLRPLDYSDGKAVPDAARQAIRGQNTWMLWGEGNEAFWGWLQENGYGIADFLVLLDSRERKNRFRKIGVMNQPGLRAQTDPSRRILGLYLDEADGDKVKLPQPASDIDVRTGKLATTVQPPASHAEAKREEPFRLGDRELYDKTIARLPKDGADPLVYGYPSGIVGLRLMPNPDFFGDTSGAAQARGYWKKQVMDAPEGAYYTNQTIHADPRLVRPFRVSMACAFCHVGPHPLNPPSDPENPAWANMSSVIGSQYWTPPNAFSNLKKPDSFLWQFVASQQPGTIDTSLVSTDHINNANTINAIFEINGRLARAGLNPTEQQSPANLHQRSIEDASSIVNQRHTPRVLLDGADSIGIEGALSRVYLNIGAYSQQWRRLHNPVIGFTPQRPFELATVQAKSVFWQATEAYRIPQLEAFFTYVTPSGASATQAMKLSATPEGRQRLEPHATDAALGRQVFLQNCAVCHSSKQPPQFQLAFSRDWRRAALLPNTGASNPAPLTLPMDYADWDEYRLSPAHLAYVQRLQSFVSQEQAAERDFVKDNYLATDVRVPITLVGTNSGRAVATNAMRGQVWDNFSSETYKLLPAVGEVRFFNPRLASAGVDRWGNNDSYVPPADGPGYYRPASLVSLWTSAPYLHNNTLGIYNGDPSIAGRLAAFDDGIDKLLWPQRRAAGSGLAGDLRKKLPGIASEPGFIYRTTEPSWIDFRAPFIRPLLSGILGETAVSFLTGPLWWLAAMLALVLALLGRGRLAAFALAAFAAVLGALLRATGIDGIHPLLWLLPLAAAAGALIFFMRPWLRGAARVLFGLSALAFISTGLLATAFVDGRVADIRIGPIPMGTPVNLVMNMNPEAPPADLFNAVSGLARGLLRVRKEFPADRAGQYRKDGRPLAAFLAEAEQPLMRVSKCPDFVLDRGHWFAEGLSDDEKKQLKAFLETL